MCEYWASSATIIQIQFTYYSHTYYSHATRSFLLHLFLLMQLCAVVLGISRTPILSKPRFNVFFWLPQMLRRPATKENKYQWWNVVEQISVMKCSPTDGIHCLDYCGAAYPAEGMQSNVRSPRKSGDWGAGTLATIFWGPMERRSLAFPPTLTTGVKSWKRKLFGWLIGTPSSKHLMTVVFRQYIQ